MFDDRDEDVAKALRDSLAADPAQAAPGASETEASTAARAPSVRRSIWYARSSGTSSPHWQTA